MAGGGGGGGGVYNGAALVKLYDPAIERGVTWRSANGGEAEIYGSGVTGRTAQWRGMRHRWRQGDKRLHTLRIRYAEEL